MTNISLENVSLKVPLWRYNQKSLRSKLFSLFTRNNKTDNDDYKYLLKNINLELNTGDFLGVLGPNGAGKTTLLKLLNDLYFPSDGIYKRTGNVTSLIDLYFGVEAEATGVENIYLKYFLMGKSKSFVETNLKNIIEFSELGESIYEPVKNYSSGMLFRLAFSISSFSNPEILIMDEWITVGDQNFVRKVENRLNSMLSDVKLLIIASHSEAIIRKLCNKAIILNDGFIKDIGDVDGICDKYFNKE